MLMLASDCSSKRCLLALAIINDDQCQILAENRFEHPAERLVVETEKLLARARQPKESMDCFATTIGPGSFTGLRIGLCFTKTLAHFEQKPCVGVSTLKALVQTAILENTIDSKLIMPMVKATHNEVYTAVYKNNQTLDIVEPETCTLLNTAAQWLDKYQPYTFGPEPTPIDAKALCQLAKHNFKQSLNLITPSSEPNYLRVSEAERQRGMGIKPSAL